MFDRYIANTFYTWFDDFLNIIFTFIIRLIIFTDKKSIFFYFIIFISENEEIRTPITSNI